MTKCGHCKQDFKNISPFTFSGIEKTKFCQSCWHRIYTIYNAGQIFYRDPELYNWVLRIK